MITEKELHTIFSENINRYRKRFNWSQSALAKIAGTSINFVNDIETGKKWASPATMVKLANALNVEVYELLKPPNTAPDNVNSLIKHYTDTIHAVLEQTCSDYLKVNEKEHITSKE